MKKSQSHSWPLLIALVICISPLLLCGAAGRQTTKPKLKVAADGLPSGHDTPEGAACDLARSFINRDEKLFSTTSIRLYAGGNGPEAYAKSLQETVQRIKAEAAKKEPSPEGPKSIGKVFAARHLSNSGPVSYGNAAFGFEDIMFVDIGLYLHNGERAMNRTLVIKDRDGKWYVHPAPSASPLLSEGLNEEKASVLDLTDVYELEWRRHSHLSRLYHLGSPTEATTPITVTTVPGIAFSVRSRFINQPVCNLFPVIIVGIVHRA